LNTALKYYLLLPLAFELCKNTITLDTVVHKNVLLLFFQLLIEALADLNNFWQATLKRNLT